MIDWSLASDTFYSVAPANIKFWDTSKIENGTVKSKGATFGSVEKNGTGVVCVTHSTDGVAYLGGANGKIYKFSGGQATKGYPIHKGVVHCIKYIQDCLNGKEGLLSGGSDNRVFISDPQTMAEIQQVIIAEGIPRSVDFSKYLLIGLRTGSIIEYDLTAGHKETIMHSHHDGEIWGLCVLDDHGKYITSCDDNKILMYDMQTRKCVQKGQVIPDPKEGPPPAKAPPKTGYVGGASTTSAEPPEK